MAFEFSTVLIMGILFGAVVGFVIGWAVGGIKCVSKPI